MYTVLVAEGSPTSADAGRRGTNAMTDTGERFCQLDAEMHLCTA